MKEKFSSFDWRQLLFFLLCLLSVLVIFRFLGWDQFIFLLIHTLAPLLFSCLLVFLFEPFVEKIPLRRIYSCSIVYFGFLILLCGAVLIIMPLLIEQGSQIIKEVMIWKETLLQSDFLSWVQQFNLDSSFLVSSGYQAALSITKTAMDRASFLTISYLAAYFIALDLDFFAKFLKRRLPSYQHWLLFYKTSSRVVYHYLRGISMDLLFLFASVSILLIVFQVKNAFLFSFLLALLNLIPYVGATVGQILILLAHYFNTGQIPWALGILLWLIQQVEANCIQPIIFKKVMNLRPIFTLISLLVCGCFFGMLGIILAPILAAIVQLAWRSYLFAKCTETVGTWESVWYNFDGFKNEDEEE